MSNYREILISFGWQIIFAVILFGSGFFLLIKSQTGGVVELGAGLSAIICFLTAAVIIAPSLAQLIANPFGKLFYSGEQFDRPQPMFSIPEGKRKSGHYQEAFDGFQKIAAEYPQELKPYIEMIDIAIVDLKNKKLADSVFHQGIATLNEKEDRDALATMYKAIGSRLEHVNWSPQHSISPKPRSRNPGV